MASLLILAIAVSAGEVAVTPLALEEVRDVAHKKLISGVGYYVLPAPGGNGGGLSLSFSRNQSCPLEVVQEDDEYWNGLPLMFFPVNAKGTIRVSTDVNIKFDTEVDTCVEPTVWRVGAFDKEVRQYFVKAGGFIGSPGRETLRNWFKIEKYEDGYKLSHCPSVCKYCKVMCKNLGIYEDSDGVKRLALSETSFKVIFQKA
ncbi:hypothetical protein Sjap_011689 [Stephania japonica]|uniref:Miraculin n=1 Tax=Stephania japonica TaxID=461633 RepID=A0AAP0JBL6_9MAGN